MSATRPQSPVTLIEALDQRARRRLTPSDYATVGPTLLGLRDFTEGRSDTFAATAQELAPLLRMQGGLVRGVRLGEGRFLVEVGLGPAVFPKVIGVIAQTDGAGGLELRLALRQAERLLAGVMLADPILLAERQARDFTDRFNADLRASGRALRMIEITAAGVACAAEPLEQR